MTVLPDLLRAVALCALLVIGLRRKRQHCVLSCLNRIDVTVLTGTKCLMELYGTLRTVYVCSRKGAYVFWKSAILVAKPWELKVRLLSGSAILQQTAALLIRTKVVNSKGNRLPCSSLPIV